jgi:hypothetical protein
MTPHAAAAIRRRIGVGLRGAAADTTVQHGMVIFLENLSLSLSSEVGPSRRKYVQVTRPDRARERYGVANFHDEGFRRKFSRYLVMAQ